MGWKNCWAKCPKHPYSPNVRLQKDKFSQQHFQKIRGTLMIKYWQMKYQNHKYIKSTNTIVGNCIRTPK